MLLGGRSAVRDRCVSRRRAPASAATQGERSLCLKLCVRALRGSCVASSAIQIHCSTQLSSQHHVLGAEESKPLRSRFCLLASVLRPLARSDA